MSSKSVFHDVKEAELVNVSKWKGRPVRVVLAFAVTMMLSACGLNSEEEFARRMAQAQSAEDDQRDGLRPLDQVRRIPMNAPASTYDIVITSDQFFEWAETKFPQFFSSKEVTLTWSVYQYRYYKDTDVYLAIESGTKVMALGRPTGNQIVMLGVVGDFAAEINQPRGPVINRISAENLKYGQLTRFLIEGSNLDQEFTLTIPTCIGISSTETDPTMQSSIIPSRVETIIFSGGSSTSKLVTCVLGSTGQVVLLASTGTGPIFSLTITMPEPKVLMKTSLGEMVIELNPTAAPITVRNFLAYVNEQFYNNTQFHRIEKGFVAQGGWIDLTPAVKIATRPAISLESNNGLSNLKGSIAMARTNEPNSATSQFYFNLADNRGLDYAQGIRDGYAVFGKVTQGFSVLDAIGQVPIVNRFGLATFPATNIIINEVRQSQ